MENYPKKLRDKSAHREDFIRVVIIGFVSAFGVNLIASGVFSLIPLHRPIIALITGLILIVVCFFHIFLNLYSVSDILE